MTGSRSTSGFTLVETLVAIAMLSGVMVATYAALSAALATASRLGERDDAVQAVAGQAAMLRSLPAGVMRNLSGETAAYRWQISVAAIPGSTAGPRSRLVAYRVLGTIIRKMGAQQREIVLDTIILGPPA